MGGGGTYLSQGVLPIQVRMRRGGAYFGWREGYLPWIGRGVPTLDRGTPLPRLGQGDRTAQRVVATVCLLRSRRRTFLLINMFNKKQKEHKLIREIYIGQAGPNISSNWGFPQMELNFHWIQRNWEITESWNTFNLRIISVTCVSVVQWNYLCLSHKRQWV